MFLPKPSRPRGRRAALLHGRLQALARLAVVAVGADVAQMLHEGAHVAREMDIVVVQDDDERQLLVAHVVQRLEGHATSERRVADEATTFSSVPFNCRAFARAVAMESESDA